MADFPWIAVGILLFVIGGFAMVQVSKVPRCNDAGGVLVRGAWFGLECVQAVKMPANKG
jgi:hypothetical protein